MRPAARTPEMCRNLAFRRRPFGAGQDGRAILMNKHSGRPLRKTSTGRLALCALALFLAGGGPGFAQSGGLGELTQRIDRLQRELQTLQRSVYRGATPPRAPAASGAQFAATVEVRLGELEALLRGLERRIESLEIAGHRAKGRFERMTADLEHRLRMLERGGASPPPVADAAAADNGGALATTIIGGTQAADAPPRPLGTLRLSRPGQPGAQRDAQVASAAPILPEGEPKEQYDHALSLIRNEQDFAKAEKAFTAFIASHPGHDLAGNAYFWLGQTHFARKDFKNAKFAFAAGVQKHPRSKKVPETLYKLGDSLGRLGETREACTVFSRLLETYPNPNRTLKTRISRQRKRLKCA